VAEVAKEGGRIRLGPAVDWPAEGRAANLPDGTYRLALRPHFVSPLGGRGVLLRGRIAIAELSGSESVAHFGFGGTTWVSQADGVHPYRVGEEHEFRLDTTRALYFDGEGRRVA
jgi:glycerol transport system ATP-binding protein